MNSQERSQLVQFLTQLSDAQVASKDSEADTLIGQVFAKQPDAAYLLVQRALLQDQALNAAKMQIADLQNQLQSAAGSQRNSFLGTDPWAPSAGNSGAVPGAGNYQIPRAAPVQAQAPGFLGGGAGSSFLGNVATTAAGVVAGSFLFQGIESLLGHHSGSTGWTQSALGDHLGAPEQTVINNYYGDDAIREANYDENAGDYSFDNADFSAPDDGDDSNWI